MEKMPVPVEIKVLMNHIYEYQKGVRPMVLYTFNKKYQEQAVSRLQSQSIDYFLRPAGKGRSINLFFGRKECLEAISQIVERPLCDLSPEEDFILGAMLGYDLCNQCKRYCQMKSKVKPYSK